MECRRRQVPHPDAAAFFFARKHFMSRAYISHDDFVKAATAGTVPADAVLRKQFVCEKAQAAADAGRKRTFIISTAAVDRDNDSISPKGWNLDNYKKNPVVLFAHDYSSLPIAKCVNIKMAGGQLIADCEFADHEMASTVLRLVDGGFLNATSVGFRPTKYSLNETRKGVDYEEQELLEYSIVPVPANPEALIVSRELIGDVKLLQEWATKTLEVTKGENPFPPKPAEDTKPGEKPADAADDAKPDDDADDKSKKAVAKAVADIATALKALPVLVARAVKGGCDCLAHSDHKKDQCSCCKSGQCAGSCCGTTDDHMVYAFAADGVTKLGRVLSGKNEAKVRAAHAHLDDVLKALPSMQDDADTSDDKDADAVVKDAEIVFDFDALLGSESDDEFSEKDVAEAMAAALKDAMKANFNAGIADIVKAETQSALNRMRGRLD
jgi:HK97 family phage prohead protease